MKLVLRSLRVINCGPLRDVCIHFNTEGEHPITVLAGANGSGKTTALELIAALVDLVDLNKGREKSAPARKQTMAVLDRTEFAEVDARVDTEELVVRYYSSNTHNPSQPDGAYDVSGTDPKMLRVRASNSIAFRLMDQIKFANKSSIAFPSSGGISDENALPSVLFFPYNRAIAHSEGSQIQKEEIQYQWVYRYDTVSSFEGSLDSYLVWLDYAEPTEFIEVIDFLNSLNFDGKTFSVRRKELKAIVTTREGNTHHLEDLSSGEQSILIMLLELRRRLLPGSIVLIDEIENSLHPAFQHRIAEGLMRLQEMVPFQLIVTTHSPTFVDVFGTGSTRILTEF